ncbi:MAG: hypothetical protein P1V51_01065 [Deltaproteobacteria bacterium]|nr:hypothetical protein [Deltaproteobacteria bacterium]
MEFFERENYEGALPFLRDAVHLDPTQGLWNAYFAWTLHLVGPPEVVGTQVRKILELMADSPEGGERARYFLGQLPEDEGDQSLDAWM